MPPTEQAHDNMPLFCFSPATSSSPLLALPALRNLDAPFRRDMLRGAFRACP